ncbi:hypothetical protein [Bacillus nitratireducens]|uniref:hypothetical protein n=1 Tax=Bacillus nitratireducens TaxID=2026193 RepID=UPI002E75BA07|nr:hypothetical protein [Bacillus nitratireducens]
MNSTTPSPAVMRASVCNPLEVTAPPKIKPSKLVDNILPIERNVWNAKYCGNTDKKDQFP